MRAGASVRAQLPKILVAFLAACEPTSGGFVTLEAYPNRRFAATEWDTVLVVGSRSVEDTTLINSTFLRLWNDRLLVVDAGKLNIRVLDRSGRIRWIYDRQGRGPGEFRYTSAVSITPAGHAWLLDAGNQKIIEFQRDGSVLRDLDLRHFPVTASSFGFQGTRTVFTTQTPTTGIIVARGDSLDHAEVRAFPWPDSVDSGLNFRTSIAGSTSSETVVIAFYHGPGFIVLEGDSANTYHYVEEIPFARKGSPWIQRQAVDSARYGAVSARIVGDEVFFLFGGRPRRYAHPDGEPTLLVDVYGLDGAYRRSYLLPTSAHDMDTNDGTVFYILTLAEGAFPQILGLRPR